MSEYVKHECSAGDAGVGLISYLFTKHLVSMYRGVDKH